MFITVNVGLRKASTQPTIIIFVGWAYLSHNYYVIVGLIPPAPDALELCVHDSLIKGG